MPRLNHHFSGESGLQSQGTVGEFPQHREVFRRKKGLGAWYQLQCGSFLIDNRQMPD